MQNSEGAKGGDSTASLGLWESVRGNIGPSQLLRNHM